MRNRIATLLIMILLPALRVVPQERPWQAFAPLRTPRSEVEKWLGTPMKYFETFGIYKTEFGKFLVWYSSGRCDKNVDGLQYNIKPQLMTQMHAFLPDFLPLSAFVSDLNSFTRAKPNENGNRTYYSTRDGSIIYETLTRKDGSEYAYSVSYQPGKDKERFLCSVSSASVNRTTRSH
jgi:hypothetical protein